MCSSLVTLKIYSKNVTYNFSIYMDTYTVYSSWVEVLLYENLWIYWLIKRILVAILTPLQAAPIFSKTVQWWRKSVVGTTLLLIRSSHHIFMAEVQHDLQDDWCNGRVLHAFTIIREKSIGNDGKSVRDPHNSCHNY